MPNYQITPLANAHCAVGENPLWHAETDHVYWTDIPAGRLFRYHLPSGKWEKFYNGPQVGGFTFQTDGSLLLFRVNEIVNLAADGSETVVAAGIDEGMARFNDVTADPAGRVFAGTIGKNHESGGVYRVDLDGSVTRLFLGTGCSNGMGFSPDHTQFYWVDTTAGILHAFDYDLESGEIDNRREFYNNAGATALPDGMAVDIEGNIWVAHWDGFGIKRFSPAGELLEEIELPVAKTTCVAFGGSDMKDLFVTSGGGEEDADTEDGTIYHFRADVAGMPKYRSRIAL